MTLLRNLQIEMLRDLHHSGLDIISKVSFNICHFFHVANFTDKVLELDVIMQLIHNLLSTRQKATVRGHHQLAFDYPL